MVSTLGVKKTAEMILQHPGLILLPVFSFWTSAGFESKCCQNGNGKIGISPSMSFLNWLLVNVVFFTWLLYTDPHCVFLKGEGNLFFFGPIAPRYISLITLGLLGPIFMAIIFIIDKFKCSCCCLCCLPITQRTAFSVNNELIEA